MATPPIDIKLKVSGASEVQGEINKLSGGFDLLAKKANGASLALQGSAKQTDDAGKVARGFEASLRATGGTAGTASTRIAAMANESKRAASDIQKAESSTRSFTMRLKEGAATMKAFGANAVATGKAASKVWDIYKAVQSGGPVGLFSAVVPEKTIKQIGFGMIAGGAVGTAALGSTIEPAMTKELRVRAIEGITGSKGAAQGIYESADKTSLSSVFDLGELTVAAKTLAKDRQFTERLLKASDDLAAASKDEGATPQDVARALGRLRAGDTGEALERMRDFGIGRPDLEAKGLKFDGGGALEDKSVAGIDKAIEAVTSIIEERFGGLSEKLATTTLAGSLSNLGDAFTRAQTVIGEQFIPVLNWGAQTITMLAAWFANLPEPIIKVIAWGTALVAMLSIVGGAILIGTLLWGKIKLALLVVRYAIVGVNFVLGLFGTSISQLALKLLTQMLPSMMMVGLAIGLIAIAALGFYAAMKFSQDASSQSAAELRNHWTGLGNFWVDAANLLEKIWNHPLLAWLHGGNTAKGNAAEDESLKILNESRKRRGLAPLEKYSGPANDDDERESVEVSRKRQAERAKAEAGAEGAEGAPADELAKWQAKMQAQMATMGGNQAAAATPLSFGIAPGSMPGLAGAGVGSGNAEIDAIQGQLDSAYLAKDKDGTRALRLQLRDAKATQRGKNKSQRDQERAQTKAQKADEREQKKAQRESEKGRRLDLRQRNAQSDAQADVRLSELDASTKLRVAQMKAAGATPTDIAQVQADAEMQRAQIRASGLSEEDDLGRDKALRTGQIKAQSLMDMAPYQKTGARAGVGAALAYLRGGGDVYHLRRGGGAEASPSGEYSQAGGAGMAPQMNDREVFAEVESQRKQSDGATIVKFRDLRIEPSSFERGLRTVRR